MRTDLPETIVGPAEPPTTGRTPPPRSGVARAMRVFVGMLVLATSMAIAAVSWWLVLPYLALMAFLLSEPAGRRVSATNPAGPGSATSGASALAVTPDPTGADTDKEGLDPSGDSLARADASAPPRARRAGKGKGVKKGRAVVEPAPATWVQVAPGKFVRVEAGVSPAEAGPHPSPPPGMSSPTPFAAEAGALPTLAPDPGPHDAPQEAALDDPHRELTPPEGLAPGGPRDPEPADVGPPRDGLAHADPPASDPGVRPDPEPRPGLDVSHVEAVGPGPADRLAAHATDGPDPAAGPQPEAPWFGSVIAEARGDSTEPEPAHRDEPGAGHPAPCIGLAPDLADDDGADSAGPQPEADAPLPVAASIEAGPTLACNDADVGPEDSTGDPSHGRPPEAAGTSSLRGSVASWFGRGVPPSPRNVRPTRAPRRPNGLRLRSSRGDGRPHHFARTFPPRSPPSRAGPRVIPTRPRRAGRAPSGVRPARRRPGRRRPGRGLSGRRDGC